MNAGGTDGADELAQVLAFLNGRLVRETLVLDPAFDLLAARVIDSMAMLELVVWMERTFGVRVKNEDLVADNFRSAAALAGYIRRSRQPGCPA
ncbi:MAG TPA: acyl carrier protein [Planctomycetota bacterium]|nr:acyl carrier protein [Planctomycetota bacterium]